MSSWPGSYADTGVFVCFEGGEGSGKSTQSALLRDWLQEQGYAVLLTFEPGDTIVGRELRRIVLSPETGQLSDRTETLLYAADKAEHVDTVVLPALDARRRRDHRPLRRLDARLPGRRPLAGGRARSSTSPAGPPTTCART